MDRKKPLLTDLIPISHGIYWGIGLGFCVFLALLTFGYRSMSQLSDRLGIEAIYPLDLGGIGSVFSWSVSVLWLFAALLALLIVRIDEIDPDVDQSGGIELWGWVALAAVYLSVDETVRFRDLIRDLMVRHVKFDENGTYWWVLFYTIVFFGFLGTRLIAQMRRRDFVSMNFLIGSLPCFFVSVMVATGGIVRVPQLAESLKPEEVVLIGSLAQLVGTILVFFSFLTFARRVVLLESGGTVPATANAARSEEKSTAKASSGIHLAEEKKEADSFALDDDFDLGEPQTPSIKVSSKTSDSRKKILSAEELARKRRAGA